MEVVTKTSCVPRVKIDRLVYLMTLSTLVIVYSIVSFLLQKFCDNRKEERKFVVAPADICSTFILQGQNLVDVTVA